MLLQSTTPYLWSPLRLRPQEASDSGESSSHTEHQGLVFMVDMQDFSRGARTDRFNTNPTPAI